MLNIYIFRQLLNDVVYCFNDILSNMLSTIGSNGLNRSVLLSNIRESWSNTKISLGVLKKLSPIKKAEFAFVLMGKSTLLNKTVLVFAFS